MARFDIRMKRTPGEHQTGGLHLHALVGDDGHALHLDQVRARSNPNPDPNSNPNPSPNPRPNPNPNPNPSPNPNPNLDQPLRLHGAAVDWLEPICSAAHGAVASSTRAALTRSAEQAEELQP